MADFRRGVRIGVDVGTVRIGIARSDIDGILAVPEATVPRGEGDLRAIAGIVEDFGAIEVIVGLPLRLDGTEGPAAAACREFAEQLADFLGEGLGYGLGGGHADSSKGPVSVRLLDERLTTAGAHKAMAAAGRNSKARRNLVDQGAAVMIVQNALDAERSTGRAPGIPVRGES